MTVNQQNAAESLLAIPAGTPIYEPDAIHRVTLQFANQHDAIVFWEIMRALCGDRVEKRPV